MSSIYSQPVDPHTPSNIDWIGFCNRWPATIDDLHPGYDFTRTNAVLRDFGGSSYEDWTLQLVKEGAPQYALYEGAGQQGHSYERRESGRSTTPEAPPNLGPVVRKTRGPTAPPAPALDKSNSVVRSVAGSLRKTSAKFLRGASHESRRKKRQAVYGIAEAARKYGDVVGLGDKYLFAGVLPFEGT
ncbi:hypothetical protein Tdes44962_MAKER00360 [Teratosphaeria destructans]|uniref:Uncharacterized protein n=1 Tax=Teratosphaeria destructans TaxID=418781 RepID=A0A9W7W2Q4_9PEZI|nr:hypothetical protein Tdes44962_MAKER00360 [Teratosphaeria destructans]